MATDQSGLTALPAWQALQTHVAVMRDLHVRSLFANDPSRGQRLRDQQNEPPAPR